MATRILAFTQGDPAGIGPEIVMKALAALERAPAGVDDVRPLVVAERAAIEAIASLLPRGWIERLHFLSTLPTRAELERPSRLVAVFDPVGETRTIELGLSRAADARGAVAAIDVGVDLARRGVVDALVTAPVAKGSIARHVLPGFLGHTDYMAATAGLERYGRDYLMAFLAPELQVALLSVHLPLARAIAGVTSDAVVDALVCLARHARGKTAVAGLNPHAGEGGLIGDEEISTLVPAVRRARELGLDVHGPESPDSLFARARRGEFEWVLALYHDQGLIAIKTASFGHATNWTLGLPYLRTSVDHGTAFHLAGSGQADAKPLLAVVDTTVKLLRRQAPALARA